MHDLGFGLHLTLFGMGSVFALLALLWLALVLIGRLDRVLGAAAAPPAQAPAAPASAVRVRDADDLEPDVLAAIALAVVTHAAARRRQAAPEMRSMRPGSQLHASRWVTAGRAQQNRSWTPRR